MQSDRFRRLLAVQGPYASVYFDDSNDTEDAAGVGAIRRYAVA